MKKARYAVIALCALVALGSATAIAQGPKHGRWPPPDAGSPLMKPPGPPGAAWHDRDVHELVGMLWIKRISERLALTDEEAVIFMQRHNKFQEQVKELHHERRTLLKDLRDTLRKGDSDDVIVEKLDKLVAIDGEIADLRQHAFEEVGEGLTMTQRAKLYVGMSEFEEEMRGLVRRAREHRWRERGEQQHEPRRPKDLDEQPRRDRMRSREDPVGTAP